MRKPFLLSLLVALLTTLTLHAYDFQSGDLYYNFTSDTTVEVTYQISEPAMNYQGLTNVTIPATVTYNGTTYSVTSIGNDAFIYCSSLTSIILPNSVTSIGHYAFTDCSALTSITLPNSVTSIGTYAFHKVLNVVYNGSAPGSPWGARSVNGYVDGYFAYADETKTTLLACSAAATGKITIPNSVTSIGVGAFEDCSALTSIILPNSVTSIGFATFRNCSSLTSITIPYSVTSIGKDAFRMCFAITSITIPNSVTSIGEGAFQECSSLTSIILPNSVTSIGNYAFNDCSSLTSITLPNSVTSIGNATFFHCSSLTSITIPYSVTSIGAGAFQECSSLTSITLPNSVTSIGGSAFSGCSALNSITLPNSVTTIEEGAFSGCYSITSINIPNSVTIIGQGAFWGCSALTSITIPYSVTSIGGRAFEDCSSLTSITSLSCTPPSCGSNVFNYTPIEKTLVVPSNSLASYKSASPWKDFTSFEKCLSMFIQSSNSTMGVAQIEQDVDCDSVAIISATANYGYHFKQWNDGNADNPRTIKLTQDTTFTAEFTPNQYTLTTIAADAERGTTQGDTIADYLTELQVSATANYGYHFTQWSDGNTDNPRTILLTKDTNVVALFDKNQYTITTYCNAEQGNASEPQTAEYLDEVTISATANYGYHFKQWSDGNADNPRTIKLTQDTTFNAEFAPNQYTLTTTTNYAERGTALGDTIADYLTELQVSATANYGYHFTQWSDGNTDNPRTILLTNDTSVVALFEKNQYNITTTCNAEQGNASEPQTAEYLDEVTISATANYGYHFKQWSDGNTDNPRTIKLTQDTTFTAEFAPNQYTLTTTAADAEHGTTQGDTIADYLTEIQVSATANYGYYFKQWNDGNTDNPRTILLTNDTNVVALFEKNQYTITTTCNAEQGTISGTQVAEYLDEITLNVLPNVGWHFTQWNDGNTDNPRTFTLTQDTTFAAEFAMDYSGKCGDDLYWAYSNQEIKITGTGAMYNYTESTMPWKLLRDSIMTIRVDSSATSIGEYAFANTPKLAELHIGANVETVGANAFLGCNRLYHIYCYPTYPPLTVESSFANYNVYLHIPCESKEDYTLDLVWGLFKHIECLDSEMGIEDTQVPIGNQTLRKVLRDGQVLIIRNGETYDMMGQRLQ